LPPNSEPDYESELADDADGALEALAQDAQRAPRLYQPASPAIPVPDFQQVIPYKYKMIQIPPNIVVKEPTSTRGRAAEYLEGIVNQYAEEGWDFFRVDQIGIRVNPGCLSALLGGHPQSLVYYVVTFRRPR
jgi:hypothetical protein